MIIRNIKFVLFGDYKNLEAQPENILNISSKFMENGIPVIPGTFHQFNPNWGLRPFERMMFTNSPEKLTVQIGMEAIEISKVIMDKKWYNFKSPTDEFVSKIKKIISSLKASTSVFNDGIRISLVVEILHDRDNMLPLSEVYKNFNNTIPKYSADETFEWNTRAVRKERCTILGNEEEFNVVTEVLQVSGQISSFGVVEEFDTVQTRIDINTIDSNKRPRINDEFVSIFLDQAYDLFSSQNAEVEVKINGANRG